MLLGFHAFQQVVSLFYILSCLQLFSAIYFNNSANVPIVIHVLDYFYDAVLLPSFPVIQLH